MANHSQNFKVRLGLFIVGGLTIFVIAIFIIGKQQNLFNPVFKVSTNFFNVSGLQVGNNVRFSGINVGTVDNIKIINDSTVQVDLLIRKNVQQFIKADSEAGITSEGIIGDRVIMISQGSFDAPMAKDGQHIASIEPIETDAIMANLQSSAVNADVITKQLAEIMTNINTGEGVIGRLIQDTTMAENINLTIANLKKSSEGIDETIEMTRVNLFEFMEKLQLTVATTETATLALGEIMTKINSGEGTLGMLIQDTTVSNTLNRTLINLEQSSEKLDENMEALQHNFLFRRYFRKKAEGKIEDKEAEQEAEQEATQE